MNCFHAPFAAVKIWKQIELEKLWTVFAFNAIHAVRKDLLDLLRLKRSKIGTRGTLSVEERIIDEEFSGYGKPWDPRETDALPPLTPWEQWRLAVSISIMLPQRGNRAAAQSKLRWHQGEEQCNSL